MNFKQYALFLVLLISGCATKPTQYSEEPIIFEIPKNWKVSPSSVSEQQNKGWIDILGDRDLEASILNALENNPSINSLIADLDSEYWSKKSAIANRYPSVNLELDVNQTETIEGNAAETKETTLAVTSVWELDIWGKLSKKEQAALMRYRAAEESLYFSKLSLAGEIGKLWIQAIEQQKLAQLAEKEITSWELSEEILENNYQAGISSQTAALSARANLSLANAEHSNATNKRGDIVRQILTLQGQFPDEDNLSAPLLFPSIPPLKIDSLPLEILNKRPDVKSAMESLKALDADASAAYRALYPQLKLSLTPKLISGELFSFSNNNQIIEGTFSILQPLLNRNNLLLNKNVAENKAEQAHWNYTQTLLHAYKEIISEANNYHFLMKQVNELKIAREQSYLASNSAKEDYEQGVGNVLDWLSLNREFLIIERQLINLQASLLNSWIASQVAIASPLSNK